MTSPADSASPPSQTPARWRWMLLASGTLILLGTVGYFFLRPRSNPRNDGSSMTIGKDLPPDPRLSYSGPFQNIHPSVAFVGDKKCAECHPDISVSFSQHPMGRSIVSVASQSGKLPLDKPHNNPFDRLGERLWVEEKDGRQWHHHAQIDDGKPTWKVSHEVQYVIGSGTRGYSYFTELDGYLFQSPISWFTQKNIWDLSPGFKQVPIPGRSIHVACLQCHANRVKERPEYFQRFEAGVFDGLSIGCERCHGPGQKHVEFQESGALMMSDFDHSIVNPARLDWSLRENVCEQCHLAGEDRILRRGRGWFDYRPGTPLEDFLSIYVKNPALAGEHKAVSHVEQMRKSKCFQGTQGTKKMGCITCHDPHQKVDANAADAHYRTRCLKCHQEQSCSLSVVERKKKSPGDACATCHMPKADSNIAHTALTEHGIIRPGKPRLPSGYVAGTNEMPIVLLHEANVNTSDPERKRDFDVAMLRQILGQKVTNQEREYLLPRVVTGLEEALRERPTDPLGWQVLAGGLLMQQRTRDTIQALERGLETMPLNEELLQRLAWMEEQIGKSDRAIEYWKRAVEVNPFQVLFRRSLGTLLAQKKEWTSAEEQALKWIELEPNSSSAHQLLILCLLETGRSEEARKRFAQLRLLHPPNLPELEAWFIRRGG